MKRRMRTILMTAGLAALSCFAQEPPPATPPPEQPPQQEPETPYPKAFQGLYIEEGWTSWDLWNSEHRFRQYATPPRGTHLRRFAFDRGFGAMPLGARLDLKSLGERDYRADGLLLLAHGGTIIKGYQNRNVFFDPTPVVIRDSDRLTREGTIRQKLGEDASLSAGYRFTEQNQFYQPPKDDLRERSRIWDAQLNGRIGPGYGGVSFADNRYFDRLGVRPELNGARWAAHYGQAIGERLNVEGSYSRARLEQAGLSSSEVRAWKLNADYEVDADTRLEASYRQSEFDLPEVQNAFLRKRFETRIELSHRFKGWTGQLSLRRNEVERVRADHTFVDVLKWNGIQGRANGVIYPGVRATVSGSVELLDGDAPMITNDPRALFWDDKRKFDVKLDASGDKHHAYLNWGYRFFGNEERGVEIRSQGTTLGASHQLSPQTEVYGEFSGEVFDAQSGEPGAPTLDQFFAGASTLVLGINWTFDEFTSANINYSQFVTNNDNPLGLPDANVRLQGWYGSVRHRTKEGLDFSVTLSPWFYTDKIFGVNDARAVLWTITVGGRYSTK